MPELRVGQLRPYLFDEAAKGPLGRLIWLPMLASLWLIPAWAGEAAGSPDAGRPELARLEDRFFHKTYANESLDERVERLEKMVFGEAKQGSASERLSSLGSLFPPAGGRKVPGPKATDAAGPPPAGRTGQLAGADEAQIAPSSDYPAVTAIEERIFARSDTGSGIESRIARLEKKLFGAESTQKDLSLRVDRLKKHTGVDIARVAPAGSDWADEDWDEDLGTPFMPQASSPGASDYTTKPLSESGRSFNGQDLGSRLKQAFGTPAPSGSFSGTYGMGNGESSSPPAAPSFSRGSTDRGVGSPTGLGLGQQVGALESEIFGRSFSKDSLPQRLSRLETTVFPAEKPQVDLPLPNRVQRFTSVIPLSAPTAPARIASRGADNQGQGSDPGAAGQSYRGLQGGSAGGLGKIINSISNFIGGGFGNGYPISALPTDPQTGLLYDTMTGNLIDPMTGVVVGQRLAPGVGSGMGGYGGYGSFNNGFAPYGATPYGSGPGLYFGIGGAGGFGSPWP